MLFCWWVAWSLSFELLFRSSTDCTGNIRQALWNRTFRLLFCFNTSLKIEIYLYDSNGWFMFPYFSLVTWKGMNTYCFFVLWILHDLVGLYCSGTGCLLNLQTDYVEKNPGEWNEGLAFHATPPLLLRERWPPFWLITDHTTILITASSATQL